MSVRTTLWWASIMMLSPHPQANTVALKSPRIVRLLIISAPASPARREVVVAVGILVTDAAIGPVDDYFAALIDGDIARRGLRLGLGPVDRRDPAIALAPNRPGVSVRHDVLILAH